MLRLNLFALLLAAFFFSTPGFAQTTGTILKPDVNVRAKPSTRGNILIQVAKGEKVKIVGEKGSWYKVKVQLDPTFSVDGWIFKSLVQTKGLKKKKRARKATRKKKSTVKPKSKPKPKPKAVAVQKPVVKSKPKPRIVQKKAEDSELDAFFEAPKATPTPTPQPTPTPVPRKNPVVATRPKPKPAERPDPSSSVQQFEVSPSRSFNQTRDHFSVAAMPMYESFQYTLNNGPTNPGKLFSYRLPGISIALHADYWFYKFMEDRFRIGADFMYAHTFYFANTELQNSPGNTFETVKTKGSSDTIHPRFLARYDMGKRSFMKHIGASLGFRYYNFSADDVQSNSGALGLFVSQRMTSFTTGLFARFGAPSSDRYYLDVGSDILFLNSVKESPADTSGTSPKGKMGLNPYINFGWQLMKGHFVELGYRMLIQKFEFTGSGSRVGTANVTDGRADTLTHQVVAGYRYTFF